MLKLIFYSMGLFFAFYKHKNFLKIREKIYSDYEYKDQKIDPISIKHISELSPEQKEKLKEPFISFLHFIWMMVGLWTYNWLFFTFVILVGYVITSPLSKRYKDDLEKKVLIAQIYTVLTWLLCVFVILNTYYFHIDDMQIINAPF